MARRPGRYTPPGSGNAAREALGRVIMAQNGEAEDEAATENEREVTEIGVPGDEPDTETETEDEPNTEELDPNEPETGPAPEDFLAKVQARREEKAAARAIPEFEKLDTKVQIGDVVNFQRGIPTEEKPSTGSVPARNTGRSVGKKGDVISERTAQWTEYIIKDLNPLLLAGATAFTGVPEFWLDNVIMEAVHPETGKHLVFWNPTLRTRLELSQKKAEKLAKAAAEFSVSPMGVALVTWVETHQFMIAVGAALVVAGQYGWTLMQTKAEVAQLKSIMNQQMAVQQQMQMAAQNGEVIPEGMNIPQRFPGFGEKSTEFDGSSGN